MQKTTIEIERHNKHIAGYGRTDELSDDCPFVLDKLIEWTRTNNYKIYRHRIRYAEENVGKDGAYFMDGGKKQYGEELGPPMNIPYCDLVCYLNIYYQ